MNYYELFPKYKRSLFFFFNKEKSNISGFEFTKGKKIKLANTLYYKVEKIDSYLGEYDYLPVSSGPPLVSKKFKELFDDLEKEHQIQFFKTVIEDEKENFNNNFFALNILNVISCLDKERSIFEEENYYGVKYLKIKKLYILPNKLVDHKIIKLEEDDDKIIVTEEFKKRCISAKLKGLDFVPEGYSIYTDI